MEASEFSQEEETEDQGTVETPTGAPEVEEIDEQPAGSDDDEDLESEGEEPEDTPETSGQSI